MRPASLFVAYVLLAFGNSRAADDAVTFPPLADRYDSVPNEARDVVTELKKLQARTEIGVNFIDYDKAVSDVYPEVKVFLESAAARPLPELRAVLGNAMDCYLKVRELWSIKISSDSPSAKYDAGTTLVTAQPTLWKVAAANISAANALLESKDDEIVRAQQLIVDNWSQMTLAGGMQLADRQLRDVERQGRAKDSGSPVPPGPSDEERVDIAALLFAAEDWNQKYESGGFDDRVPMMFRKVPPAVQEGQIPLCVDGDRKGGVVGFVYRDSGAAKKAYDAIRSGFGRERLPVKGLGNRADASVTGNDIVFARANVVVHARAGDSGKAEMTAALQRVDERIRKAVGEGADGPAGDEDGVAEKPMAQDSDKSLVETLFRDGDFGKDVEVISTSNEAPAMFMRVRGYENTVRLELGADGEQGGAIQGFFFDDETAAKRAYDEILSGFGSGAARLPGLGNTAAGSTIAGGGTGDVVFRRGNTVVHVRARVPNHSQLVKPAKKIDARIRKQHRAPVGVDD